MFRSLLAVSVCFIILDCFGQEVRVNGKFQTDSLLIGQPIPFSLSATYTRDLQLLFPDSTYDFTPYELHSKQFFPTRTQDSLSYDSVVYHLASFEVDSLQVLRLPVYVVYPGDCTEVWSRPDTIFLKHLVADVPDTVTAQQLPLKTNTEYLNVSWMLNYPILMIVIGALIAIAIVLWLVFGKRVRKYFRVKRLKENHYRFLERYEYAVNQVQAGFTALKAESALVIWKKYMEGLEGKPYTKFTSKEIAKIEADEKLARALRGIDRMVYGGIGNEPKQVFAELQDYSQTHFTKKLQEVTHE